MMDVKTISRILKDESRDKLLSLIQNLASSEDAGDWFLEYCYHKTVGKDHFAVIQSQILHDWHRVQKKMEDGFDREGWSYDDAIQMELGWIKEKAMEAGANIPQCR